MRCYLKIVRPPRAVGRCREQVFIFFNTTDDIYPLVRIASVAARTGGCVSVYVPAREDGSRAENPLLCIPRVYEPADEPVGDSVP